MAISRLFDFQAGTRISSDQMDAELNQLVAANNNNEALINSKDTNLRATAQLTKITADTGSTKLTLSSTSQNILQEIVNLGIGMHTFYCVAGAINNPAPGRPIRGLAHITGNGFGWLQAFDSEGEEYVNVYISNVWKGWRGSDQGQVTLWTGSSFPSAAATITPSKKLSECRNGWMLIWSDNNPGVGPQDTDFVYSSPIPKLSNTFTGKNHLIAIPYSLSSAAVGITGKRLTIFDDHITGSDDNGSSTTNSDDVVLRAIVEW